MLLWQPPLCVTFLRDCARMFSVFLRFEFVLECHLLLNYGLVVQWMIGTLLQLSWVYVFWAWNKIQADIHEKNNPATWLQRNRTCIGVHLHAEVRSMLLSALVSTVFLDVLCVHLGADLTTFGLLVFILLKPATQILNRNRNRNIRALVLSFSRTYEMSRQANDMQEKTPQL